MTALAYRTKGIRADAA